MGDRNDAPDRAPGVPANDNGQGDARQELDRVAFSIARLIGRRMAREYFAALTAANDNHPPPGDGPDGTDRPEGES
ncbi:hypothetical protein [Acetobacter estunensis]|uniref:hypothetical protein n=1 Tax=Acetobacter estunensis TaxID=104097 RepID=UPI001C2D8CB7|nr:hypothetical protein [Acetobacter estunensis]MBV1838285.1 hypothetical protein [Acetobacter estunensis]